MGALSPHTRGTLTTIMPALVAGMMGKCKRRLDFNSYMILFLIMSGPPEGGLMRRHAGGSDAAPAAGRERFSRTRAAPGTPPDGHYEPSAGAWPWGPPAVVCFARNAKPGRRNGRPLQSAGANTWMAGTSPAVTGNGIRLIITGTSSTNRGQHPCPVNHRGRA